MKVSDIVKLIEAKTGKTVLLENHQEQFPKKIQCLVNLYSPESFDRIPIYDNFITSSEVNEEIKKAFKSFVAIKGEMFILQDEKEGLYKGSKDGATFIINKKEMKKYFKEIN